MKMIDKKVIEEHTPKFLTPRRLLTYENVKPIWLGREINWEWFLHSNETYFKNKMKWAECNWPV